MTSVTRDIPWGPAPDWVIDRLVQEFDGVHARETVVDVVRSSTTLLPATGVSSWTPLLTHRFARERLRAAAVASGAVARAVPDVLFVCTRNAGRSQLAAALLEHHAAGRVVVRSAGTAPVEQVQADVVTVLAEIGVDAVTAYPKPLTEESVAAADVVVTTGCGDACPVVPGRRYLDWDLPDPEGRSLDEVRALRDRVDGLVRSLLEELLQPADGGDGALSARDQETARLVADPLRARMLDALAQEQLCTCHLVDDTGARQSNVSNHLRALREAGLVDSSPHGRFTYHRLDPRPLRELADALTRLADAAEKDPPRRPC